MGLDISISCDVDLDSHADYWNIRDSFGLSRNFCSLILTDAGGENVELPEIGRVVGLDLSPLIEMGRYRTEAEELDEMEFATSDEAKQEIRRHYHEWRRIAQKGIQEIRELVHELIVRINRHPDFAHEIRYGTWGHRDYPEILRRYFSKTSIDDEKSYVRNNFREDLRNLLRYLDYAIGKGATKVWFDIG